MVSKFQDSINLLLERLSSWGETIIVNIPNLVVAIIVMVISVFLSRWIKRHAERLIVKVTKNYAVSNLLAALVALVVFTMGLFLALSIMNLDKAVTSLLAGAGIVGMGLALAFQEPIINTISGVVMSVKHLFKMGDIVDTNGYSGTIEKITLRDTHLKTFTGELVIIPNKLVVQNPLINYTMKFGRRVDVFCGVDYGDDLDKVEQVTLETIKGCKEIDFDESHDVDFYFTEFGDSAINFRVSFWLNTSQQKHYLQSKSVAIKAIKKAFDREGFNIPFPVSTIDLPKDFLEAFNAKKELKKD